MPSLVAEYGSRGPWKTVIDVQAHSIGRDKALITAFRIFRG